MNLILLNHTEIDPLNNASILELQGNRAQHIINILRAEPGDSLKVGLINGNIGKAQVTRIDHKNTRVTIELSPTKLNMAPPAPSNIQLIIALPRPKVARRLVRLSAECGIKKIHFMNSYKVEKSYWGSPLLGEEKIHEQMLLGLEQAGDTLLPAIHLHRLFKPFVEDQLPALINNESALVLHPYADNTSFDFYQSLPAEKNLTLIIGPEGGFIPYEIEKLESAGCTSMGIGSRIYRTETIVPMLIGLFSTRHPRCPSSAAFQNIKTMPSR